MKISKRVAIAGLSALMIVIPCFAQTKIISLNGHEIQADTKEYNYQSYVPLTTVSDTLGYHVNYNNHTKIVTITKDNKNLTLSLAKNEAKAIDNRIYVPIGQLTSYFGDSIEVIGHVSYKDAYLEWLDSIERDLDNQLGNLYADTSTLNLIELESTKCEAWDKALNEIYGILKEELSDSEMEKLRQAQRNWIVYRDSTAQLEQDNSGGSIGRVIYVSTLCELTKERCYYLVNNYMP